MVAGVGFEPTAFGLWAQRATSCSTPRYGKNMKTKTEDPAIESSATWLRRLDLNQRPSGYEPDELPNCSIPRYFTAFLLLSPECLFIISQMNVNVNTFFAIFLFWLKTLDYCIQIGYNIYDIGVWRRLVARYLGVVEAVGSSPATQTKLESFWITYVSKRTPAFCCRQWV